MSDAIVGLIVVGGSLTITCGLAKAILVGKTTERKAQRVGTLPCFIFGHKFVSREYLGADGDYDKFIVKQANMCARCGADRKRLAP